jgi:flagellin-like protein
VGNESAKFSLRQRRGVSNIIGSLVVLAIVASIGSVILFQGLNQINAFNHDLSFHDREYNEALREDVLFEHIKFHPNSNGFDLYLANIGSIDTTVASVTMVKIDTQEAIFAWEDVNEPILIEDHTLIQLNATSIGSMWNQTYYNSTDYKVSITTSKGNFFSTVATPYDT